MILPELLVCAIASSIAIRILTLSFVRPVSDVWEKLGGGQADIYYPDFFEGCWQVGSTLVAVETPKGIEYTNDAVGPPPMHARTHPRRRRRKLTPPSLLPPPFGAEQDQIQQAIDNELNRTLRYEQCFVRNSRNRVVADRMHNTRMITEAIMGARDDIAYTWNVDDPNVLKIHLRGLDIFTRVTRRFSSAGGDEVPAGLRSLETSELFEQVGKNAGRKNSISSADQSRFPSFPSPPLSTGFRQGSREPESQGEQADHKVEVEGGGGDAGGPAPDHRHAGIEQLPHPNVLFGSILYGSARVHQPERPGERLQVQDGFFQGRITDTTG